MYKKHNIPWWNVVPESQSRKIEYPSTISSRLLLNMCPVKENSEIEKRSIKLQLGNFISFLWQNMDKITGILIVLIMVGQIL